MHSKNPEIKSDLFSVSSLSDDALILELKEVREEECNATMKIVRRLREVLRRDLHLRLGFDSLFQFSMEHLNYSEGEATRRINTMRLADSCPDVEDKIKSGGISLTVASMVQSFSRKNGLDAVEVLQKVSGQSSRRAERTLRGICPLATPGEKIKILSDTHTEVRLILDQELLAQLDELKSLLSHTNPGMNYRELVKIMAEQLLNKFRAKSSPEGKSHSPPSAPKVMSQKPPASEDKPKPPKQKDPTDPKPNPKKDDDKDIDPISEPGTKKDKPISDPKPDGQPDEGRFISSSKNTAESFNRTFQTQSHSRVATPAMRRHILERDQTCTYEHNGRRCNSTHLLEIDHVISHSDGGKTEIGNLTTLCRAHNQFKARQNRHSAQIFNSQYIDYRFELSNL